MYTCKDSRRGLVFLNTCPHNLNLIKDEAVVLNRSGKYYLREKYCEDLNASTLFVVENRAFVLSVNDVMNSAWNNGNSHDAPDLGMLDFNQDIPFEDSNYADIIVVSEKCAAVLRAKLINYLLRIPLPFSKVSCLNNFQMTGDFNENQRRWMALQLFLDRFYVLSYLVYHTSQNAKGQTSKKVVGALRLRKVLPPLPISVFIAAFCNGWSVSRVGANRAGWIFYEAACHNVNLRNQYNMFKSLLEQYYQRMGHPQYYYTNDCPDCFR